MPAGVSQADSATALDTLGGAVDVAGDLPAPVGVALLEAAQAAFTDGLVLVSLVSAVMMAALAVGALVVLRRVPKVAAEPADQA
jgi:DHA2 family multidrug resistance protein-like MFS transporter